MDLVRKLRLAFVLGTLALTLGFTCDASTSVTAINETSEEVRLFYGKGPNANLHFTLAAGETLRDLIVYEMQWEGSLVARNASGEIIFELELTWEKLQELEQIVIK